MRLGKMLILTTIFTLLTLPSAAKEISSFSEITDMAESYTLAQSITLPEDFTPVGTSDAPFTGTFDGAGFTVSGAYTALFACTDGAVIRNVAVTDGALQAAETVGGIVGRAEGETVIELCSFEGTATVSDATVLADVGGIVGHVGEKATVSDCTAKFTVTVEGAPFSLHLGGICAQNDGTVRRCLTEGSLSVKCGDYLAALGGIAAENRGSVVGCVNRAALCMTLEADGAQAMVGGICGYNDAGTVTRCINAGSLAADGSAFYPVYGGGICGINRNGSVDVTKNLGTLTVGNSFAGGAVGLNIGYRAQASLTDSLNVGEAEVTNGVFGGIVGKNLAVDGKASASVGRGLNRSTAKGVGANSASVSALYSLGEADGVSTAVTAETLITDGLPTLGEANAAWVENGSIGALPDLIVVSDLEKPELVLSESGENGTFAYYLYSPADKTYAESFIAVYYSGSRYLGSSYVLCTADKAYTGLVAESIPEGTDRIKLVAFSKGFTDGFAPSAVKSVETAYPFSNK